MSMEQAILEHAAAMKELAAAFRDATKGCVVPIEIQMVTMVKDDNLPLTEDQEANNKAEIKAELEEAVGKVEKAAAKKNAQAEPSPAEPAAQTKSDPVAPSDEPDAPLDYRADVKPTLLKVHQDPRHGADALKALLKKYNAPNGDKLKPEDLPGILADAQALLAG